MLYGDDSLFTQVKNYSNETATNEANASIRASSCVTAHNSKNTAGT
jgi:hypothetical protein